MLMFSKHGQVFKVLRKHLIFEILIYILMTTWQTSFVILIAQKQLVN